MYDHGVFLEFLERSDWNTIYHLSQSSKSFVVVLATLFMGNLAPDLYRRDLEDSILTPSIEKSKFQKIGL